MPNAYPPHRLRTEYLTDPLGLDEPTPRFSWELRDDRRGAKQTAYRLLFTAPDGTPLHDTGKVATDQSTQVEYPGPALRPKQAVTWRVQVWDHEGAEGPLSAPAFFETGLLGTAFDAKWICSTAVGGPRTPSPAPYLRRAFSLPAAPVSARLYVTALGLYEARINGRRVGRDELTPGWTDYRKTVHYQTYDVTALLTAGDNCLGAILGDGWYAGSVEWRGRQFYGDRPHLLARLEVKLADGSTHTVATDGTWRVGTGEILEGDLIMGEAIDLRRAQPGWDTATFDTAAFDDAVWTAAVVSAPAHGRLVGQAHEPVRVSATLKPASSTERPGWPSAVHVHDFGQNLVGKVRLKLKGAPDTTVRVRYAEVLKGGAASKPTDPIYTDNLRSARATDYFTLPASGEGTYETRFTFHGFRYAEVQAWPGKLDAHEIEALVMHSAYESTGEFTCSDPLLNQLQHNIRWGWRGNSLDVPTDCPQRDERLGWTGDAQVFVRTAAFNFDTAAFWSKWAGDVADAQKPDGAVPPTCPTTDFMSGDGGPAWADAALICPWTIHKAFGDTRLLGKHYDALARFLAYLDRTSHDGARGLQGVSMIEGTGVTEGTGLFEGFGDWLSINADTPKDLIGSAFYAYAHRLMSEIAAALGKTADAARHADTYRGLASKFRHRYITPAGKVVAQTQTAALLALHFDLADPAHRPGLARDLVADIRKRGTKLSCGFVGSPYLAHVLAREGHVDVAYDLLLQKQWPSWLYAVTQGATTIWERWDGWTHDKGFQDAGMNSFNHYAYGAIGDWMYQVMCGLDAAAPGYKQLLIAPTPPPPGKHPALTHARATLRTPYGPAESGWRIDAHTLHLRFTVPPNTTALFRHPLSKATTPYPAGTHEVTTEWKA